MALNITTAVIGSGCNAATASPSLAQWDKGQILQISGVELPETYKVEFSNGDTLEAIPAIGTAEGVEIPDKLLYSSSPIRAYIVLSEAEGERNTEYWVTIYVKPREIPEDIEPDPAQQDVIDDLIAQLNTGVGKAEAAADEAEASAQDAEAASQAVQDLGVRAETAASGAPAAVQKIVDAETGAVTLVFFLPQGEAGVSPVVTVTAITGGHRVTVTDAEGAHAFDVMDGRSVTGVTMGADYKLTFTFSDGTTWTTPTSIRGETGATPRLTIGTVSTLDPGQSATASITGTPEDPVLNLGIPKGQAGASDAGGVTYDPTETYQSGTAGAALNDLSRHLSDLTMDGSIMSLEKIVPVGFASNTGKDTTTATNYWNTGLVYIGANRAILTSNYDIYKIGFFGQFGDYLGAYNTTHNNIPIPENVFYVKVQFENTIVSFANASSVKLYVSNETVIDPASILPNGIKKDNLDEELVTLVNKIDGIGDLSYSGERIKIENKFTYGYMGSVGLSAPQSAAVYGDLIFTFSSSAGFNVRNLTSWKIVGDGNYPTDLVPHANVAFFGTEFYDPNDNFPIVYLNAYNNAGLPKGTLYAFRIANDFTMTLVQTITIGFTTSSIWTDGSGDSRPYGNFAADFDYGYLYAYTLKDTSNVTRFFKFNLPKLSDGDVTFAESDILDYWDCDYFRFIQDNFCKDGKIYLLSGYGVEGNNGFLRVVNTVSKKEVSRINLNKSLFTKITSFEPELITLYNGDIIIGHSNMYRIIV